MRSIVLSILDGTTAAGTAPVGFTKRSIVRQRFATMTAEIIARIDHAGTQLTDRQRTALVRKLAAHCTRAGWQRPDNIVNLSSLVPVVVEAVTHDPASLTEPRSLQGLIDARIARRRQRCRPPSMMPASPMLDGPVVIDGLPGGYALVELIAPEDLQAEGNALGHCLGSHFNDSALRAKRLSETDPAALDYLTYAIRIRNGSSRIFSLRHGRVSLATLEYKTRSRAIAQAHGDKYDDTPIEEQPYFPVLCMAIEQLRRQIPLTAVPFAPPSRACEMVCTCDGRWARAHEVPATDILFGSAAITNQTPQADIDLWADNALLWLDISSLSDRSRLPCHIEAGLKNARQTPSGLFELPHVESAANLLDIMSTTIRLPSLRSFRTLTAWNARSITLPLLQHGNLLQTHEEITGLPGSICEVRALHGGGFKGMADVGWPHYSSRANPAFRYI